MILFNSLISPFLYFSRLTCVSHLSLKFILELLAPFCEEISGMVVDNFWDPDGVISTLKVRIRSNQRVAEFINNPSQGVKILKKDMIGILDLKSLGYFKVNYEDIVRKTGSTIYILPLLQE